MLGLDALLVRNTALILIFAELQEMNLIRAIDDAHGAALAVHLGERGVLRDASAAIGLDGPVDNLEVDGGDENFDLCYFLEGRLGRRLINLNGSVEDGEASGVNLEARAGDAFEHDAVLVEELAKRLLALVVETREEPFKGFFGGADAAHGVVDAAGAKPTLDDFEAAALAENHVGGGDAYVGEADMAVAVGGVVEAHDGKHAVDGYPGGGKGDKNDGLLLVFVWVVGVRLSEDDEDLAAGVADT